MMNDIPDFKLVVVYDDFVSGIRARDFSDRLAARLEPEFKFSSDLWKFDFLVGRVLREQAAAAAAEADIIIVSADAATVLPGHVKSWMDGWLPQQHHRPSILIALIHQEEDRPCEQPSVLCAYLRQIAEAAGMDFFCKTGTSYGRHLDFEFTAATIDSQPEKTKLALEEILHQQAGDRGWSTAE
jgi:hypothetical protein